MGILFSDIKKALQYYHSSYDLALGTIWRCTECSRTDAEENKYFLSLVGKRYARALLYYGNMMLSHNPKISVEMAQKALKVLISSKAENSKTLLIITHLDWASFLIECNRLEEARKVLSIIEPYLLTQNIIEQELANAKCRLIGLLGLCFEKYVKKPILVFLIFLIILLTNYVYLII